MKNMFINLSSGNALVDYTRGNSCASLEEL